VFTLVGAFSVNAPMLIASRFLAGIGIGAELPLLVDTYGQSVTGGVETLYGNTASGTARRKERSAFSTGRPLDRS
jgi:MFS family permease